MTDTLRNKRPLRWKLFNLIYLGFYFPEWLWRTPTVIDITAIILAVALFIPLFFSSYERSGRASLVSMFATEGIALALAPFSGLQGVFHIYACVQAGFQRPGKHAGIWIMALTVFYAGFIALTASLTQDYVNAAFALVFGVITGISCISAAESMEREKVRERSQFIEKQHARLAERERIAHDLHDVLGHTLTMVALKSEVAAKLIDRDPARATEEIQAVASAARDALRDIRETVYGMTVTTLETELALAERALAEAGVTLTIKGDLPELDARQSKALGMTIREATTNIVRHAQAHHANISFVENGEQISVDIIDDGISDALVFNEGAGLTGLRERIRELGGQADIINDAGFCIKIRLPMTQHQEPTTL